MGVSAPETRRQCRASCSKASPANRPRPSPKRQQAGRVILGLVIRRATRDNITRLCLTLWLAPGGVGPPRGRQAPATVTREEAVGSGLDRARGGLGPLPTPMQSLRHRWSGASYQRREREPQFPLLPSPSPACRRERLTETARVVFLELTGYARCDVVGFVKLHRPPPQRVVGFAKLRDTPRQRVVGFVKLRRPPRQRSQASKNVWVQPSAGCRLRKAPKSSRDSRW